MLALRKGYHHQEDDVPHYVTARATAVAARRETLAGKVPGMRWQRGTGAGNMRRTKLTKLRTRRTRTDDTAAKSELPRQPRGAPSLRNLSLPQPTTCHRGRPPRKDHPHRTVTHLTGYLFRLGHGYIVPPEFKGPPRHLEAGQRELRELGVSRPPAPHAHVLVRRFSRGVVVGAQFSRRIPQMTRSANT